MDDIYQQNILDHYKNPHNLGKLKTKYIAREVNASCGDAIEMSLIIKNRKVSQVKFGGHGCAISIASASMLTDYVVGKTRSQINKLNGRDAVDLLGINVSPGREKCILISLVSLKRAINKS